MADDKKTEEGQRPIAAAPSAEALEEEELRHDPFLRTLDYALAQRPEEKQKRLETRFTRLKAEGREYAEARRAKEEGTSYVERSQTSEGEDISPTK